MELINIYESLPKELSSFHDDRGSIIDVFYGRLINHVNIIHSVPGVVRGNHFHQLTIQHILILEGNLDYWYKDSKDAEPRKASLRKGDLATSMPGEIHAMKVGSEGCTFMSFSEGPRGGKDYESDTYRVESIVRD